MKDRLSRKEFEGVLEAVNAAASVHCPDFLYFLDVADWAGGWAHLTLLLTSPAKGERIILTKHFRRSEEEEAYYGELLGLAVELLDWPNAASREEASVKIALAGSAKKIADAIRAIAGEGTRE